MTILLVSTSGLGGEVYVTMWALLGLLLKFKGFVMSVDLSKRIVFLYTGILTKDVVYHLGSGFCRTKHIAKAGERVKIIEEIGDKVYVNLYDSFVFRLNKLIPKSSIKTEN